MVPGFLCSFCYMLSKSYLPRNLRTCLGSYDLEPHVAQNEMAHGVNMTKVPVG